MTKDEFVKTYLEGASFAQTDIIMKDILGKLFDERQYLIVQREKYEHTIEFMDDVVRDQGFTMKCRSCDNDYQPDCELSEMFGAENYCGRNEWCTP